MSPRSCLLLSAISGCLAVVLGAFGAHGLGDSGYLERRYAELEPRQLQGLTVTAAHKFLRDFETGVRYHMWHSLALGLTGLLMLHSRSRWLSAAAWAWAGGILLFSGSLYVLVIGGPRFGGVPWGMVAPIGGTLLVLGWCLLAAGVLTSPLCRREPDAGR